MVRKYTKYISRKLPVSILLALVTSIPGALQADDYAHMIQYELRFGNKQPVSNLYLLMGPGVTEQSLYGAGNQAMFRTPVISTDPHKFTLLKPLSVLFSMEESESSDDAEFDSDASAKTAGEHFGTIVGGLLFMAPILYAISSAASDIGDIGNIDLDIPEGIEIDIPEDIEVDTPEPPPEEGS